MKLLFFILFNLMSLTVFASFCPQPSSAILPEIDARISKSGDGYNYKYVVTNNQDAKIPIQLFWVETSEWPKEISSPAKWMVVQGSKKMKFIKWGYLPPGKKIEPGASFDEFEFVTDKKPGLTRAYLLGDNSSYLKKVAYTDLPRSKDMSCPGFWEQGSSVEGDGKVAVLIEGPASSNRATPILLLRKSETDRWSGSIREKDASLAKVSPLDKGNIEVMILGGENFDVTDIDLRSIKFGRGLAAPKSSEILTSVADHKFAEPTLKSQKKALRLKFNIEEVNPLCGIDRALFLEGKMKSGDELFTGAKIQSVACGKESWSKESKKILNRREPGDN